MDDGIPPDHLLFAARLTLALHTFRFVLRIRPPTATDPRWLARVFDDRRSFGFLFMLEGSSLQEACERTAAGMPAYLTDSQIAILQGALAAGPGADPPPPASERRRSVAQRFGAVVGAAALHALDKLAAWAGDDDGPEAGD